MAMPKSAPGEPIRLVQPAEAPVAGPLAGDPGMLGLPSFLAGSVALGLAAIGLLPGATTNAALPILLAAASVGLFLATIWSAATGQNAAAGIYGIFGGFYLSYAILLLGLIHNWFGIGLTQIVGTQKVFLVTWIVIVTMLVLATLRLPVIFTALFALVDVALLLNLLAVIQVPASTTLVKAAGWVIMAFSAIGIYLFFTAAWHATGGRALPTGKAILHA